MTDVCPTCGLPKDLCVCETIAKESQRIEIFVEKKKFGKNYTVVTGINPQEIDLKDLLRTLKEKMACGGTAKDGNIELQGDHKIMVREALIKMGFAPETIFVR